MYFLCYGLLKNFLLVIIYYKRRDIWLYIIRYRRNGGFKIISYIIIYLILEVVYIFLGEKF